MTINVNEASVVRQSECARNITPTPIKNIRIAAGAERQRFSVSRGGGRIAAGTRNRQGMARTGQNVPKDP